MLMFVFFKQKTAYEMRISDWSSDVCSSDLHDGKGQKLTLYVSTDQQNNHDSGFRFAQEGLVNVFYWMDGKFGYALSANIDRGKLARIAGAVYEQLEKPS